MGEARHIKLHVQCIIASIILYSIVTVSKILPSVSFGRFCKKNLGFRFGFGSHNKRIVNVEAASDAVILSHVVLRLLTMHIDIISVNRYQMKITYLV